MIVIVCISYLTNYICNINDLTIIILDSISNFITTAGKLMGWLIDFAVIHHHLQIHLATISRWETDITVSKDLKEVSIIIKYFKFIRGKGLKVIFIIKLEVTDDDKDYLQALASDKLEIFDDDTDYLQALASDKLEVTDDDKDYLQALASDKLEIFDDDTDYLQALASDKLEVTDDDKDYLQALASDKLEIFDDDTDFFQVLADSNVGFPATDSSKMYLQMVMDDSKINQPSHKLPCSCNEVTNRIKNNNCQVVNITDIIRQVTDANNDNHQVTNDKNVYLQAVGDDKVYLQVVADESESCQSTGYSHNRISVTTDSSNLISSASKPMKQMQVSIKLHCFTYKLTIS